MVHFLAIASNGSRVVKENLDNFDELQEFMNKMEQRGFLNVLVQGTSIFGNVKEVRYLWDGQEWKSQKSA